MPKSIYYDENGNEQILSSSPSALTGLQDTDIQSANTLVIQKLCDSLDDITKGEKP